MNRNYGDFYFEKFFRLTVKSIHLTQSLLLGKVFIKLNRQFKDLHIEKIQNNSCFYINIPADDTSGACSGRDCFLHTTAEKIGKKSAV